MKLDGGWQTPYEVKRIGNLFTTKYWITFEEGKLFYFNNKEAAERIAAALNGAYNLGRSSKMLEERSD